MKRLIGKPEGYATMKNGYGTRVNLPPDAPVKLGDKMRVYVIDDNTIQLEKVTEE